MVADRRHRLERLSVAGEGRERNWRQSFGMSVGLGGLFKCVSETLLQRQLIFFSNYLFIFMVKLNFSHYVL